MARREQAAHRAAMHAAPQAERDVALVRAVQGGDGEALAELLQRNDRWLRGVVFTSLGDVNLLDDVMQKVWLSVWQRCGQMQDVQRWRYWLYRMARNAAIDAGRRKQRRGRLFRSLAQQWLGGWGARREIAASEQLILRETHQRLLAAIRAMPEIYREPFVLRHMEGWSYQQIAETLDMPIDTVGTRLVRARRALQQTLGDRHVV